MAEDSFGCCATCTAAGKPSFGEGQNCVAARDFDAELWISDHPHRPDGTAAYLSLNRGAQVVVHKCEHGWAYGWVNSCGPGWFPHGFVETCVKPAVPPCVTCGASRQPGPADLQYGWASCDFDPQCFHASHGVELCEKEAQQYVTLTQNEWMTLDGCDGGWAHGWGSSCGPGWFPHSFVQLWHPSSRPSSPATGQARLQPWLAPSVDNQVALACFAQPHARIVLCCLMLFASRLFFRHTLGL